MLAAGLMLSTSAFAQNPPASGPPAEPAPAEPAAPAAPSAGEAPGEAPAAPSDAPTSAAPTQDPAPTDDPGTATAGTAPPSPPQTILLPPPPPPEDDLPIPTLTLDRVPPNTSFEFAIQVSYGTVAYFRDQVPPWVGFGFRAGWGKNLGLHRIGVAGGLIAEGDIGVHTQLMFEPALAWDHVGRNGLLLGASVGPSLVWTSASSTVEVVYGIDAVPTVAARIGWSQTWSRVGRRLFLFAEPKARFVLGRVSPVVAIAVGSGGGR